MSTRLALPHQPAAPRCAARPHASAASDQTGDSATTSIPATWTTVISGMAAKLSDEARERDPREDQRADRKQREFGRQRREQQGPGARSHHARGSFAPARPRPIMMPSVAPNVSQKATSATESGAASRISAQATASALSGAPRMVGLPRQQVDDRHHRRPNDRRAPADDGRVGDQRAHRHHAAGPVARPGQAQPPEQQAREDRDVAAGDGDDVVGAGLLQPPLHVLVEAGAIADQNRGDDGGRLRVAPADVAADGVAGGARSAAPASASQVPRASTSTSVPLLTVPTRATPFRASASRASGTPGSR